MSNTTTEDTYTIELDEATVAIFKTLIADTLRNQAFDTRTELTTKYDLEDFGEALAPNVAMVVTRSMLRCLLDEVNSNRPVMTDAERNEHGMKLIRFFVNNKNHR